MVSYKIELNSKPIKGTKEHKLMLRITVNKKHSRVLLDYAVTKSQFNPNPKQQYKNIRANNPEQAAIHSHIEQKIKDAKSAVDALNNEGKTITARAIKQRMIRPKSSDFLVFATRHYEDLRKAGNIGNFKKYRALVQKVKEFIGDNELYFSDIDTHLLDEFSSFLKKEGNAQSTIQGRLKAIRALVYKAIDREVIQPSQNPFFHYKIKSGKPVRSRLSEEEIKLIENHKFPSGQLIWHAKNAFLFSFYCAGMRASDIIQLKWKNIQNGRLSYQMQKTGKLHSIKLTGKATEILNLYETKGRDDYVFPFLKSDEDYSDPKYHHDQIVSKTALINKYLKDIAKSAKINKKISTHTARHSFADIARKKTDNIYNLSKTLGHSDLKITEAYLASFDEDAVDSTIDDVFNEN